MRTLVRDTRVTVNTPDCPPPDQVTRHVVVAVTGNTAPGIDADDRAYVYPHVGDDVDGDDAVNGVPGPVQVTE